MKTVNCRKIKIKIRFVDRGLTVMKRSSTR